ncbi:MAG: septation protein SepH [Propionicimonas sp.]|nr:septation protein SepH [Propionicimonas sp.]MEA5117509.1 septation protein SepH [Propionicimonas sp.]
MTAGLGRLPTDQHPHTHAGESQMASLTPREIQTRIRAGESVDDVARDSGMDPERVEAFAVPVIAEREHIASQAQQHPVRRGGETIPHRTLGAIVTDRLLPRQVDVDSVDWDSWKSEGRRWTVQVTWTAGRTDHTALFTYDQAGRFSVPDNDDARWLLGLHPPAQQDALPSVAVAGEAEPTVGLNDDLALVRVVQPGAEPEDTAPIDGPDDGDADTEDAYAEGELTEVDGVYDIVTDATGGIDVLYDMLSAFDEDSVQIYSGLLRTDADAAATPVLDERAPAASEEEQASADAEQPTLTEALEPEAEPAPEPEPKGKSKRRRAHVPSWDEIMFGSPKQP